MLYWTDLLLLNHWIWLYKKWSIIKVSEVLQWVIDFWKVTGSGPASLLNISLLDSTPRCFVIRVPNRETNSSSSNYKMILPVFFTDVKAFVLHEIMKVILNSWINSLVSSLTSFVKHTFAYPREELLFVILE